MKSIVPASVVGFACILYASPVSAHRAEPISIHVQSDTVLVITERPLPNPPPGPIDSADSAQIAKQVRRSLIDYYMNPFVRYGGALSGSITEWCHADEGERCFFGDVDALICNHGIRDCIPKSDAVHKWLRLASELELAALTIPADTFVMGQAVYLDVKAGRTPQALEIAQACAATWWCEFLQAYVYYHVDQRDVSRILLEGALAKIPEAERCWWTDITPLLPSGARGEYEDATCAQRANIEKRAWWLADPLWLDEGNDRWTEHMIRKIQVRLHENLWALRDEPYMAIFTGAGVRRIDPRRDWREYRAFDGHVSHHQLDQNWGGRHRGVVAIGFPDSWRHVPDSPRRSGRRAHWRQWVSNQAARYRFFPQAEAISNPTRTSVDDWDFNEGSGWERFSSLAGSFTQQVAHAHALFRRGDSALVALATDLTDNDFFEGRARVAGLVLASDETDQATMLFSGDSRGEYIFRTFRSDAPMVASLEVLAEGRTGRVRYAIEPPWDTGSRVTMSDLLLYQPVGPSFPEDAEAAIALMRGSHEWEEGSEIGIFWELYGLRAQEGARVSVEIRGTGGGIFGSLARGLGFGDDGESLQWMDSDEDGSGIFSRTFTIDVDNVDRGDQVIIVTVQIDGQEPIVRESRIRLVAPGSG